MPLVIEKMPWCATAKSISAYLLCTFCLLAAMMLSLNFDGSGSMAQLGTVWVSALYQVFKLCLLVRFTTYICGIIQSMCYGVIICFSLFLPLPFVFCRCVAIQWCQIHPKDDAVWEHEVEAKTIDTTGKTKESMHHILSLGLHCALTNNELSTRKSIALHHDRLQLRRRRGSL